MKSPLEKSAALLGAGLLAFTLSACGADDDTSPVEEEPTTEQFDEFEDDANQPDQGETPLDEDGAPGPTENTDDPDLAPGDTPDDAEDIEDGDFGDSN